jgi:molybdenum cofactor synthesis domain-containing protein
MIELGEAQRFVLERVAALEPREWPLARARGCVVASHVVAREAIPGFANSSMDGYALRSSDATTPGARLRVVDSIHAGDVSALRLEAGQAMRIMTGAPLPDGADCVCMVEETVVEGDVVTIARTLGPGDYVRQIGEDTEVGQALFAPGDELNPTAIGVLAGQGFRTVLVHPRPRVGVLSTGNELVSADDPLGPGQIRDLNRPLLLALLEETGCTPVDLGTAKDTAAEITSALSRAVEDCDAVISTGGVSVGDVDFVKVVIGELGAGDARWMQVAIKPAKPFAFGVVGPRRTPLFGLPGNPVSTRVSFEMFVRPALRVMAGHLIRERITLDAVLDDALEPPTDAKVHLVHVTVGWGADGVLHVTDAMRRGSHLLNAIAGANAIATVAPDTACAAGDRVRVMILDADSLGVSR